MAKKKKKSNLTSAEAEVMNIVWDDAPVAVPDIVEKLQRRLAYTTVMTTVKILEAKGFVIQCGKRSRAFLYQASIGREDVQSSMVEQLADKLFGSSVKSMALSLVRDKTMHQDDLAELKRMIEKLESDR